MTWRTGLDAAAHHGMRAYYIPVLAGLLLASSAFQPWILLGDSRYGGVPDLAGLWILGLGLLAVLLAALSIATRRNSRHPLLLVGLSALGILFIAYQLLSRAAEQQAWAAAQALAIVDGVEAAPPADAVAGTGFFVGIAASIVLVLFGLTIVVRRVAKPYAEPEEDDV